MAAIWRVAVTRRWAILQKLRYVLPRRYYDAQRAVRTFVFVVLLETLPQPEGLHPDDRILSGIEAGGPAQRLYRDVVFLDLVGLALEIFGADIVKEQSQTRGLYEDPRCDHRLQFDLALVPILRRFLVISMYRSTGRSV
jgi:hypothetical protein